MADWFNEKVAPDWMEDRQKMMSLLQDEAELEEIVKMVGMDALSAGDRLKMEAARSIREDFLHQNSFHEVDTYSSLQKQYLLMKLVIAFYEQSKEALDKGANIQGLIKMDVREKINCRHDGDAPYVYHDRNFFNSDNRLQSIDYGLCDVWFCQCGGLFSNCLKNA